MEQFFFAPNLIHFGLVASNNEAASLFRLRLPRIIPRCSGSTDVMGTVISTRNFDAVDDFGPFLCKSREFGYGDPVVRPAVFELVEAAGLEPAHPVLETGALPAKLRPHFSVRGWL